MAKLILKILNKKIEFFLFSKSIRKIQYESITNKFKQIITVRDLQGLIDKKAEIKKEIKKKAVMKISYILILLKAFLNFLKIISKFNNIKIKIPKIKEAPKAILLMRRNKKENPIKRIA